MHRKEPDALTPKKSEFCKACHQEEALPLPMRSSSTDMHCIRWGIDGCSFSDPSNLSHQVSDTGHQPLLPSASLAGTASPPNLGTWLFFWCSSTESLRGHI